MVLIDYGIIIIMMVLEKQYSLKVKNRLWRQLDLSVKWGWLA